MVRPRLRAAAGSATLRRRQARRRPPLLLLFCCGAFLLHASPPRLLRLGGLLLHLLDQPLQATLHHHAHPPLDLLPRACLAALS